jgi:hypothetical protein
LTGNKIVFFRGATQTFKDAADPFFSGGQEDLLWISGDGGNVNFIAKAKRRSNPHFTKTDDRIYLYHAQKGLVSIRWDGTDEKAHLKVSGITVYGSVMMDDNCMLKELEAEQGTGESEQRNLCGHHSQNRWRNTKNFCGRCRESAVSF